MKVKVTELPSSFFPAVGFSGVLIVVVVSGAVQVVVVVTVVVDILTAVDSGTKSNQISLGYILLL